MTNTIHNVPRELLENLIEQHITAHGCTTETARRAQLLLSAPSPAGVDGLEVVAQVVIDPNGSNKRVIFHSTKALHELPVWTKLSVTADAQAIIDGLRGEVERLHMQLAACGVVALANTIESAGEARQMHQDYMSASCSDVADAVDREIALRAERDDLLQQLAVRDEEIERIRVQLMTIASAEPARHSIEWAKAMASTENNEVYAKWREAFDQRDQQAQRIGELEGLLRHAQKQVPTGSGLHMRIDAALSAVCAAAPNIATTSEHSGS